MNVSVNGEPRDIPAGTTVGGVVDQLSPHRRGVAVAVNRQVVPRSEWDVTMLGACDQVEVLGVAQGG